MSESREVSSILSTGYTIDFGAEIKCALELFKKHAVLLILFSVAFIAAMILTGLVGWMLSKIPVIKYFAGLPSVFVMQLLMASIYGFVFQAMRGKTMDFSDYFSFLENINDVVKLALIMVGINAVAGVLGIIPVLGAIIGLLIGIGTLLLMFAMPLVVERHMDPFAALDASYKVFLKNPVAMIVTLIICGVIVFVGALCLGVGLIIAIPFACCFLGCVYDRIFGVSGKREGAVS